MNKIYIFLFAFIILSLNLVSAQTETIGPYDVGDCVVLEQSCSNCTYSNISSIISPSPNSSTVLSTLAMSTTDNIRYQYNCLPLTKRGTYIVNGYSDVDGVRTVWAYDVVVSSSILLWVIIVCLAAFFLIMSLFGNTEFFLFLSGALFVSGGVLGMIYGISTFNEIYTRIIAFTLIGLGVLLMIGAYMDFGIFGLNKQEEEE